MCGLPMDDTNASREECVFSAKNSQVDTDSIWKTIGYIGMLTASQLLLDCLNFRDTHLICYLHTVSFATTKHTSRQLKTSPVEMGHFDSYSHWA